MVVSANALPYRSTPLLDRHGPRSRRDRHLHRDCHGGYLFFEYNE